jgi:hypothetical protein
MVNWNDLEDLVVDEARRVRRNHHKRPHRQLGELVVGGEVPSLREGGTTSSYSMSEEAALSFVLFWEDE